MPRLTDATKAARRAQIIEAAIDCFLERGYTNTSMSDIIKASGLSSGSIYSHFSGKEDILISAINERLNNARSSTPHSRKAQAPRTILETTLHQPAGQRELLRHAAHPPRIAPRPRSRQGNHGHHSPTAGHHYPDPHPPGAVEQLSVLHEIDPTQRSAPPSRKRSSPTTPATPRTPS